MKFLKIFIKNVERENEKLLKYSHRDNRVSIHQISCEYGIRHQKFVPHTPQHNKVAERMNGTSIERIRSTLSLTKLFKSFLRGTTWTA